jgi:hypothetical protein
MCIEQLTILGLVDSRDNSAGAIAPPDVHSAGSHAVARNERGLAGGNVDSRSRPSGLPIARPSAYLFRWRDNHRSASQLTRFLLHIAALEKILMNSDKARERAEKSFKKEERAQDGRKAMIEYESQARATREKTARLKEFD